MPFANTGRQCFCDSLKALVEEIANRIDSENPKAGRERTWGFLSTLVGSLLLARGVADDRAAAEILAAGRAAAAPESSQEGVGH